MPEVLRQQHKHSCHGHHSPAATLTSPPRGAPPQIPMHRPARPQGCRGHACSSAQAATAAGAAAALLHLEAVAASQQQQQQLQLLLLTASAVVGRANTATGALYTGCNAAAHSGVAGASAAATAAGARTARVPRSAINSISSWRSHGACASGIASRAGRADAAATAAAAAVHAAAQQLREHAAASPPWRGSHNLITRHHNRGCVSRRLTRLQRRR
jgi:hypothetical protein